MRQHQRSLAPVINDFFMIMMASDIQKWLWPKFPRHCPTVEKKTGKHLNLENLLDRGSNPGPQSRQRCYPSTIAVVLYFLIFIAIIIKAENYKPSGAPCALASLFTSVQHFLQMLVHYLVTLSYKPVKTTSLHIRRSMFLQRLAVRSQSQSPNRTMPLGI